MEKKALGDLFNIHSLNRGSRVLKDQLLFYSTHEDTMCTCVCTVLWIFCIQSCINEWVKGMQRNWWKKALWDCVTDKARLKKRSAYQRLYQYILILDALLNNHQFYYWIKVRQVDTIVQWLNTSIFSTFINPFGFFVRKRFGKEWTI